MIFRNQGSLIKKSNSISRDELIDLYGLNSYEFTQTNKEEIFVCSKNKDLDLIELDQLLQTVGWSRRPIRRVKRALDFSILVVGLWRHDDKFPRLVGFARCTGDGILEATVWDVAINPVYQGLGLGKELMKYVLKELKNNKFDMVFIDADKMNYKEYYEKSFQIINKGGLIIIDNVLWHGEVVDEDKMDKYTLNIRELNEHISRDERVEQIIIPLGDGMTVCRVL